MEKRSTTIESGSSIMGSLVNKSPHFARALESTLLACRENDNCIEKLTINKIVEVIHSFKLSSIKLERAHRKVSSVEDLNLCLGDIDLDRILPTVPAKVIQSALKISLGFTNYTQVIRVLDVRDFYTVQFGAKM